MRVGDEEGVHGEPDRRAGLRPGHQREVSARGRAVTRRLDVTAVVAERHAGAIASREDLAAETYAGVSLG
jgi:hypothetical protein